MATTKTNRNINWSSVIFTPTSGSAVTIPHVQGVQVAYNPEFAKGSGDAAVFNTIAVAVFSDPTMTVRSQAVGILLSLHGLQGTLAATWNDARNAASSGAITFTMSNASILVNDLGGAHKALGEASITTVGYSSNGTTSPLGYTIVADIA